MMKVKDFMIQQVHKVQQDQTLKDVLRLFIHHRISGVPVTDANNKLVGMISDGDVLRYINPQKQTVYDVFSYVIVTEQEELVEALSNRINTSAKKIMKTKIHSVSPEDELEKALQILAKHHFKKLPVVNEHKQVVGVISRGDLLKQMATKIINLD
ncbi:CBS domain-containing protein [Paenibacillus sp. CAA11]|uniref:CBS domain-containing protein n=1 Tax=Paenibacillus sp. CAA11 TaxID=1532905 RepID=UPI001F2ED88A|nr:CBS domain-containing protein [Paenibacillus sp. CAA11]